MEPPAEQQRAFLGVERSLGDRWWRPRLSDDRMGLAIAQKLNLPEVMGRVLAARDVSLEEAETYLQPTLRSLLPDPSLFHDMDRAAERLADAVTSGELVAVFGDYDVDGATSSALLKRFLESVGARSMVYIPDRIKEGYGPNLPALISLKEKGAGLVLTVDCGTTAFDVLEEASGNGLDIIVVDHHLAEARLPDVFAVINPNRLDEDRAYSQLAAVGVTFLLVVATNRALRRRRWFVDRRVEPNAQQWLDMVALGTVCDVVPLKGVNRAFVTQGLKMAARRQNIGMAALADVAGLEQPPDTYHLGFVLGPRVNAGGRVGRPDLGSLLLTCDDPIQARAMAEGLDGYNNERKAIEAQVQDEAFNQLAESDAIGPLALAVGREWHAGVIGIVASRLKDKTRRPALVISLSNGIGKGSGRSVPGVDLGAAVTAARQAGLLINGGGHAMAAGLTVAEENLAALADFLAERVASQTASGAVADSLGIDGALSVSGAREDLLEVLAQAGPYGAGNPEPRFVITSVRLAMVDVVGKDHVRCQLTDSGGGRLKGIAFRCADSPLGQALLTHSGRPFHVAGHLRADYWRGERRVQLTIEDAAPAVDS